MNLHRIIPSLAIGVTIALVPGAGTALAGGGIPTYHATLLGDMIEEVFPGVTFPSSDPTGLNENGDLVGEAPSSDDGQQRAWIYTVEHGVVALPVLPGQTRAMVTDISDRDADGDVIIVGAGTVGVQPWTAALWRFSTVTGRVLETRSIGIPPGFDESTAVAVNNDGIVVGSTASIGPYTNWKYDVATEVLESFDFPWRVADLNNVGQVCGGAFRGDLFGNSEDLSETYDPGDVMPQWAIDNGGIGAGWHRINDLGWVVGRAGTGISDGAGHFLVAIVRFADELGWTGFDPISHLSLAGGINGSGDFMVRQGGIHLDDLGQDYSITALLAPEWQDVSVSWSFEINDNRQIAGAQAHAFLLTPLGEMIIPGDVNGDVRVDLDDHCAWLAAPIDLNDDGAVDTADEQWLIDRLAVFGFTVQDCNGNGIDDHCDITTGPSSDCDADDVPDECQADCSGDGVPDACEPDCNANGVPDPCDLADFTSTDCNFNGIPDECDNGGVTEVLHVFDPPHNLILGQDFVSSLSVIDTGVIADVNFNIEIDYRIGYLTVLLSHNGTTITLIDRPGHPQDSSLGHGQLGYDIILDDEGAGGAIEDEGSFGSPFEPIVSPPSFTPNDPLSAFDGMPVQGAWTVTIIGHTLTHPVHTFHDWGVTIRRAAAPLLPCDCNLNGTPDDEDILAGTSADADGNGVPDECQAAGCPADVDGSAHVGFADLSTLLEHWGPCAPAPVTCPCDLDGDGSTGFADLSMMLGAWGPCP